MRNSRQMMWCLFAAGLHDQTFPTIYAALPEQLGLKIESGKGPVLVVDKIEPPTEN